MGLRSASASCSEYVQTYLDCLEERRPHLEALLCRAGFSWTDAQKAAQEAIIEAVKLIQGGEVETLRDCWWWLPTAVVGQQVVVSSLPEARMSTTQSNPERRIFAKATSRLGGKSEEEARRLDVVDKADSSTASTAAECPVRPLHALPDAHGRPRRHRRQRRQRGTLVPWAMQEQVRVGWLFGV